MPKTPKLQKKEKTKRNLDPEPSSWEADQKERGYYYDDAHGYQTYDPMSDDNDEEKVKDK